MVVEDERHSDRLLTTATKTRLGRYAAKKVYCQVG